MNYLLTGLRASKVNLLQNDYCGGLPAPTAFLGLAAAVAHDLGLSRWDLSALPILHRVDRSNGRLRPAMEVKSDAYVTVELQEDLTGTVSFSMVLSLPEARSEADILAALTGKRLGGGVIFGDVRRMQVIALSDDPKDLLKAPRGYALLPWYRDGKTEKSFGDPASLRRVASALWPDDAKDRKGWRVPVAIGFRLLGSPGPAPTGARNMTVPHVFAEPGVGVAELVSIRSPRLTDLSAEDYLALFWSWAPTQTHVLVHKSYHSL